MSNFKAGEVYVAYDRTTSTRYIYVLIRQLDKSDKFFDGWGYNFHTPFGCYWQTMELTTGKLSTVPDNYFNNWINLTDYSDSSMQPHSVSDSV